VVLGMSFGAIDKNLQALLAGKTKVLDCSRYYIHPDVISLLLMHILDVYPQISLRSGEIFRKCFKGYYYKSIYGWLSFSSFNATSLRGNLVIYVEANVDNVYVNSCYTYRNLVYQSEMRHGGPFITSHTNRDMTGIDIIYFGGYYKVGKPDGFGAREGILQNNVNHPLTYPSKGKKRADVLKLASMLSIEYISENNLNELVYPEITLVVRDAHIQSLAGGLFTPDMVDKRIAYKKFQHSQQYPTAPPLNLYEAHNAAFDVRITIPERLQEHHITLRDICANSSDMGVTTLRKYAHQLELPFEGLTKRELCRVLKQHMRLIGPAQEVYIVEPN